jgi:uncharacterized protein DUF3644
MPAIAKKKRTRRIFSIADELVAKSREAALAAVQIFNNPQITFKSDVFIVLMNIAWTYLLHAYYRKRRIDYRYSRKKRNKPRRFERTAKGAYKFWELERCLNNSKCPVDPNAANNLRFLIGVRHEIEHQMTRQIDSSFSAKFQACCLNYNDHIKKLFGDRFAIDKHLALSLQFSGIAKNQLDQLSSQPALPKNIQSFVDDFENKLTDDEFKSTKFAYRVLFVAKTANRKGQADQVIEFVKADSDLAKQANKAYAVIKETERPKFLPGKIVAMMKKEGYPKFSQYHHTQLWKQAKAKDAAKGLGVHVESTWYWYEPWLGHVREYCKQNKARFA